MTVYYNEFDPYAAQWLRNLIDAGHIARGVVDERSIEDVHPSDLEGFAQCHFFAGVGVWSLALRRAGWPDDRPVWTGSCPCQPFSPAGKGAGFADERHLWPAFFHLIAQRRPEFVFGEQVEGQDGLAWLDLVHADLEAKDYACGAVVFPAAGIGAPHIRHRLYWVAHADNTRLEGRGAVRQRAAERPAGARGLVGGMADSQRQRCDGRGSAGIAGIAGQRRLDVAGCSALAGGVADADGGDAGAERQQRGGEQRQQQEDGGSREAAATGPVNGFWRAADWLACRDGRWRPVEPCTFPLAHGAPARMGRLRAYGNAVNAYQAQAFIECVMETTAIPQGAIPGEPESSIDGPRLRVLGG